MDCWNVTDGTIIWDFGLTFRKGNRTCYFKTYSTYLLDLGKHKMTIPKASISPSTQLLFHGVATNQQCQYGAYDASEIDSDFQAEFHALLHIPHIV